MAMGATFRHAHPLTLSQNLVCEISEEEKPSVGWRAPSLRIDVRVILERPVINPALGLTGGSIFQSADLRALKHYYVVGLTFKDAILIFPRGLKSHARTG